MPYALRNGSHQTVIASSHTGSTATTGASAVTADVSMLRRAEGGVRVFTRTTIRGG